MKKWVTLLLALALLVSAAEIRTGLQKAGLKIGDIVAVYLSPSDARAAFVSGGIDAWVAWDPYFASAQKFSVRAVWAWQPK